MGSCTGSKRDAELNQSALIRKISIKPSQFVAESQSHFSHFYKVGKKLGGGNCNAKVHRFIWRSLSMLS